MEGDTEGEMSKNWENLIRHRKPVNESTVPNAGYSIAVNVMCHKTAILLLTFRNSFPTFYNSFLMNWIRAGPQLNYKFELGLLQL